MKNLWLYAVLGFILGFVCHRCSKGEVTKDVPPPNVVRVQVMEKNNYSYGTGALLSERIVVTNNHVVRDRKSDSSIKIIFPDWTVHTGKVVKAEHGPDLAAIRLDEVTTITPLRLGSKPVLGDVLYFWGYGSAIPKRASGEVTGFYNSGGDTRTGRKVKTEKNGSIVEINTPARNGDSGSPFLNEAGEYAGTLFGSNGTSAMGSHVSTVLDFLGWDHDTPAPRLRTKLY